MIKNKSTKMKDLSKTWVITVKQFEEISEGKIEEKQNFQPFKNSQCKTWPLNATNE